MPERTTSLLRSQVKLLAICLFAQLAAIALLNAMRLHFAAWTDRLQTGLNWFIFLCLIGSVVAMNSFSVIAAIVAVVKKAEYRVFALIAAPSTTAATVALIIVCIFGDSQINAAFALGTYVLAIAIYRLAPGKIWPPESLK